MSLPSLNGNWVDLVIILVLAFFIAEGVRLGFWTVLSGFASFLGALVISLRAYQFAAQLFRANFSLSHSVSNALGFLATAIIAETVLAYLLSILVARLPKKFWKNWWNRLLAVFPAFGEGLVLTAFGLTLIIGLPIKPSIKADIADSRIGSRILRQTSGVEAKINEIFGGVIEDSLTYLTVKPGSRKRIEIKVEKRQLSVDEEAEAEMFKLVNEERKKSGLPGLIWKQEIVPVARAHATDMWEGSYFGHVSPEGKDVGDRLERVGIDYLVAGENLALAPTLSTAHMGLINSPGHRANILEEKFTKVGVGVIDNGVYGKMFVQVFTN